MMMIKRRKEEKLEVENVLVANPPHNIVSRIHEFNTPIKNTRLLKMVSGANYLPKDNEWKPRGEDAHFICSEEHTIGVADGVSGWAKKGIDAGEYARELMSNAVMSVHNEPKGFVDPSRVLSAAYSNTKAQGSSTACIITLRDNYLHAANVGDSGFFVFRKGEELVYQSPVQQRSFNCPYQLGNSEKSDRPSSAAELKVEVEPGDIIVAGTDGLLDNMFATEIKEVLVQGTKDGVQPDQLAFTIANYALYNSFDRFSETPFATNARQAGKYHRGGKIDDITVIVSHIVQV